MKARQLPPIEYLRSRLDYDPETGGFTWKAQPIEVFATVRAGKIWNIRFAGVAAGNADPDGYLRIRIDGRSFLAHRLAFAIATGIDPGSMKIDHVDGNKENNRLANLRLATHAQNLQNRTGQDARNTSGFRGVYRSGRGYQARLQHTGKKHYLGTFDTPEQAAEAAKAARAHLFGDFAGIDQVA